MHISLKLSKITNGILTILNSGKVQQQGYQSEPEPEGFNEIILQITNFNYMCRLEKTWFPHEIEVMSEYVGDIYNRRIQCI